MFEFLFVTGPYKNHPNGRKLVVIATNLEAAKACISHYGLCDLVDTREIKEQAKIILTYKA